jgi:hypothetical protein
MTAKNTPSRRYLFVVLFSIMLGVVLNLGLWWWGLWLAPPWLEYTVWLQCALVCLWIPVLVVVLTRLRLRGCATLVTIVIGYSLLSALSWLTLLGPTFSPPVVYNSLTCRQGIVGQGQVRYTCISTGLLTTTTYMLEGPEGWPIAWLKETKSSGFLR